jgi:hypothetical protein
MNKHTLQQFVNDFFQYLVNLTKYFSTAEKNMA